MIKKCINCKREFKVHWRKTQRFCCHKCFLKYNRGKNAYQFKGKIGDSRGYIKIYIPDHPFANKRYILEHRLVMEKYLRENKPNHSSLIEINGFKYLNKDWIVHHKNDVKDDNRIENLEVMTISKHNGLHSLGNKVMLGRKLSVKTRKKMSKIAKKYWKKHSTAVKLMCSNCGKEITRQQYRLRRSKHHFCSFKCYKEHGTGLTVWL